MPRTKKPTTAKTNMTVNTVEDIDKVLDTKTAEPVDIAPELSETVLYMDIVTLRDNFANGSMAYSKNKYYMRKGDFNLEPNDPNIIEKNKALYNFETKQLEILEPIVFETVVRGDRVVKHLVSGNSRVKTLLTAYAYKEIKIPLSKDEKLESIKITEDNFADIPYREFNGELTDLDFIRWQTNTNDFTKKHNTFEIAMSMAQLKKPAEEGGLGLNDKKLAELFGRSTANVGQLLKFANCDNEELKQLVIAGRMNTDTAYQIVSATRTKSTKDKPNPVFGQSVDTVLASLKRIAQTYTGTDNGRIYLKYLKEYKDTLDITKSGDNTPPNTNGEGITINPPGDNTPPKPPGANPPGKTKKVTSLEDFDKKDGDYKTIESDLYDSIDLENVKHDKLSELGAIAEYELKKLEITLKHVPNTTENLSRVWELITDLKNQIDGLAYDEMKTDDNSRTAYATLLLHQKKPLQSYKGKDIKNSKQPEAPDQPQNNEEVYQSGDLTATAS